jgi:hypothetical protein
MKRFQTEEDERGKGGDGDLGRGRQLRDVRVHYGRGRRGRIKSWKRMNEEKVVMEIGRMKVHLHAL